MAVIPPEAREAMEFARSGDLAAAVERGEAAILRTPHDAGLRMFVGMLHARQLDLPRAAEHLGVAVDLAPHDPLPRLELIRTLIGADRLEDAEREIRSASMAGSAAHELRRLRAMLHRRRGEHGEAVDLFTTITTANPADFESFESLGLCLLALDRPAAAADALARALALRPGQLAIRTRLAEAQVAAGNGEAMLAATRDEAARNPSDVHLPLTIARLEDLLGRPQAAEAALRDALALDPANAEALSAIGELLERDNKLDELAEMLDRIEATGAPPPPAIMLRARWLGRKGRYEEGRQLVRSSPESVVPGTRAQLYGQFSDRLGDHDAAFAAYAEMNRIDAMDTIDAGRAAKEHRDIVAGLAAITTPAWYAGWTSARPSPGRPAPAFIFGFPRSGTTLLDTVLMGHPGVCVLEEELMLQKTWIQMGSAASLADLDQAGIDALRARYFAEADAQAPDAGDRLIIDKLPLGAINTALVHRIFPDARIVFVARHPCDVVLSCFMTRFAARGMTNFLDLEDTARFYAQVVGYWHQCREVFPLAVHDLRYERMIEDVEGTMRPLSAFLGLGWDPRLLDHVATAKSRSYIATPSYAQVAEPLYTRARGRWERYRAHMAPVLPILAPLVERMGYAI
ncbi:tetratricopeptide repeat-containing sulfotransferase family protein [Sphingomonas oryzagri]